MTLSYLAAFAIRNANATQGILFALVVVSLWLTERVVLAQSASDKLRHARVNILLMLTVLPVQLCMTLICVHVAYWTQANHVGLVYLLPDPENPFLKFGFMFLALDFLDYVYHYIAHRTDFLWQFHLVHHTDRNVDVTTTFREHPGETLIRVCFLTLWVLICGASIEVLILRQTIETVANVSQHTALPLPRKFARALSWIFVTPNLHHAHHHYRRPGTNCNYGDVFSIWDRLFGTYVELAQEDTVFGLDTHMAEGVSTNFLGLLGVRDVREIKQFL